MAPTYDSATKTPTCNCGAAMVLRNGKYGKFYGCSTFPKCRQTRPYNGDAPQAQSEPEKEFTPSHYQVAVFDFIREGRGHGVVDAKAGSGKTTTIVKGLSFTPEDAEVAFVAFNRHIANTLAGKAPPHVHVSTLHSLGYGNVRNALGDVKVEPRKVWYLVKDLAESLPWDEAEVVDASISSVVKLVSLLKATLREPTDGDLDWIADRWNVELNGDRALIYQVVKQVYRYSVERTATIDYDDMIFYCATGKVPCKQFDYLFVDETQDLNKAQLEMAVRSVKLDGRIVAVGDPSQSIYGFRGADVEAMPRIIERLGATVLPLSITYRCPKSHVALAQTLVPEIEAAEWAEDGVIEGVSEYGFLDMVKPGDLVLCRTNAPLVGPAFNLIRQGVKATILGRDIGQGLMALVKKVQKRERVRALDDTLNALADYRRREIAKLAQAGKELAADALDDKVETIFALSDGCYTVAELERKVERVFSDEAEGVTFGTVHKTKGGEADRVFILKPELMPHPKASDGWEMEQEWNIKYVAYTRAKKALYFVGATPTFTMPGDDEGTEGQDRESYTDEQDRESYTVDPSLDLDTPLTQEEKDWLEHKAAFARREAEQERAAFLSELDHLAGDFFGAGDVLVQFPKEGRFESNIFRPSAWELAAAMSDWMPTIEANQLVLVKDLAEGHAVKCYTSITVGNIAGGTGEDSIRVVREDAGRDGKVWRFKNNQDWVTRRVPADVTTNEAAAAHLAAKVEAQVNQMTRPCPECGALRVKCKAGKGRDARFWWKATCEHRVKEGGW